MLKIVIGILILVAGGMFVYAQIAWKDEMKDWPRPEDREPESDDNYCSDMDAQ